MNDEQQLVAARALPSTVLYSGEALQRLPVNLAN
jgi:hypothetical protein